MFGPELGTLSLTLTLLFLDVLLLLKIVVQVLLCEKEGQNLAQWYYKASKYSALRLKINQFRLVENIDKTMAVVRLMVFKVDMPVDMREVQFTS